MGLTGILFIHKVNGENLKLHFEELPKEKQQEIVKMKSKEWLENMVLKMSDVLSEISTKFGLYNNNEIIEEK